MLAFLASILYGTLVFYNFHTERPESTLQDYAIQSTQNPFDLPMQVTIISINSILFIQLYKIPLELFKGFRNGQQKKHRNKQQ